jgi:hypothetical protein
LSDTLIIGVALYNISIPASLKEWIDLVCRTLKTFTYSDDGPKGLMTGKKAIVCFASGGTPLDQILISPAAIYCTFLASSGSQMLHSSPHTNSQALTRANAAVDALMGQL